ncbi:UPF0259 membrane protein YciC [Serratia symbiotica]|nr:UPF0259 membrane protein YciC [Serratia symbiotica]
MPITANVLYRDSLNFFRNQLTSILMLVMLTASISLLLNQILGTDSEILKILNATNGDFATSPSMGIQEFIRKMRPEQQIMLLKATVAAAFSALVGKALLIGGVLTLLRLISQGQDTSAIRALVISIPVLPRLMLLLFICSLLIQLGLRLLVVPGVIMAIAFSLSSIITTTDKQGVFDSIKLSCRLAFFNVRVIVPAMLLWVVAKLLLFFMFGHLAPLMPNAARWGVAALGNLVSALLLIYLFRLYILLRR